MLVSQSYSTLCDPVDCSLPDSSIQGIHQQEYWVGWHFLLQGIFPTKGSSSCLPHCRQILYLLSHQENAYLILWSIRKKNNKDYCSKRKKNKFWRSSSISWKRWLLIKLINMKDIVEWRNSVCMSQVFTSASKSFLPPTHPTFPS